jgi:hypothetical protein
MSHLPTLVLRALQAPPPLDLGSTLSTAVYAMLATVALAELKSALRVKLRLSKTQQARMNAQAVLTELPQLKLVAQRSINACATAGTAVLSRRHQTSVHLARSGSTRLGQILTQPVLRVLPDLRRCPKLLPERLIVYVLQATAVRNTTVLPAMLASTRHRWGLMTAQAARKQGTLNILSHSTSMLRSEWCCTAAEMLQRWRHYPCISIGDHHSLSLRHGICWHDC